MRLDPPLTFAVGVLFRAGMMFLRSVIASETLLHGRCQLDARERRQGPAGVHVPVEVEHVLAALGPRVRLHAEAALAEAGVFRELRRDPNDLSEEGLIVGLGDRCNVLPRYHED